MERNRVQKFFSKPSLTRQSFKDECDLAKTIKRFAKTEDGRLALKNVNGYVASDLSFEDVSNVPEYRQHRDAVNAAEASFMRLPSNVRRRFNNDTAEFLDFVGNPANIDELRYMGLAKPKVEATHVST